MLEWCLLCKWLSRSIDQEKTFFLWSSYRWEGILIFRASVGFCQMVWRSGLVLFCLSAAYCFILLFLLAVYLTYSFEIKSTATKDHSPYVSFPGLMCMITFFLESISICRITRGGDTHHFNFTWYYILFSKVLGKVSTLISRERTVLLLYPTP